ncbi:MAG: MFS transporter [Chloroflexi bacterium]|nr:MFS transporter [Chloroflexota bacterium]
MAKIPTPTTWQSTTFASLRYKDYRWMWLGSITEHAGEWAELTAISWLVLDITGSPFWLGLVAFARSGPRLVFPLIGGVVADRINRRNLLMSTLVAFSFLSVILAALVLTHQVQVWQIFLLVLLGGIAQCFNHPARATILPNLVPRQDLVNAVSLDMASVTGSRIFGPPLAGLFIGTFGISGVLGVRALGALVTLIMLLFIDTPLTPFSARKASVLQNFSESTSYLKSNSFVFFLITLWVIPFLLVMPYVALLPVFARDILKVGPEGYGLLMGAPGLGAIVGVFTLASIRDFRRKGQLIFACGVALGVFLLSFAFSKWFALSLFMVFIAGGTNAVYQATNNSLLQLNIPDALRGRIMSFREVATGMEPLGNLVLGAGAELMGAPLALGIQGVVCSLVSLASAALLRNVRRLQ